MSKAKSLDQLIGILNRCYGRQITIFGLLERPCVITHTKHFSLPSEMQADYKKNQFLLENSSSFGRGGTHNEPHVVYRGGLGTTELICETTDYATCRTYRMDYQKAFPIISGNVLVICPEKHVFVVQKRADSMDWNPGLYTLFGGGYLPQSPNSGLSDNGSILNTVCREFKEETGGQVELTLQDNTPCLLTQELRAEVYPTGSIQFNFLGVGITKQQLELTHSEWEGKICEIPYDDIHDHLRTNQWTAFARASVLVWLCVSLSF